jgi:CheY-like chemotaxis protein
MFNGSKILIVEDEAIIAMHLAVTIEDHRGEVVGLAASVSEAITMISTGAVIHGAILDGNLVMVTLLLSQYG